MGGGDLGAPPAGGINPSGGGDFDSQLGSALGEAFDAAAGEETPAAEPAAEPPAAEPVVEDPAAAEPVAEPEPVAAEPVAPVAGDAPQYQLTPDGKAYQIPKAEFATIQQAQKYHSAVSQLFPTPQAAETSYRQASDLRSILNDYTSGADQNLEGVLNYLVGNDHQQFPETQRVFQQSFAKLAQKAPDMLAKINPQAHEAMVSGMVSKAIEMAYEKAAATGSEEDLKRAQELDWGATGQYKTEIPKVDPQVKAQQEFESRQAQFNRDRDTMRESQLQQWNQSQGEVAKFNETRGLIDKTLAKVKDRYTEAAFEDLRTGIENELKNAMAGFPTRTYPQGIPGQKEWFAEHKQAFDQLLKDYRHSWSPTTAGRGLEAQTQAYRQSYVNRANQYLPAIAAPRITAATRTPGAARTAQLGRAPQRAAAQPAAAPAAAQPNKRLSSDEWQAELNQALTIA